MALAFCSRNWRRKEVLDLEPVDFLGPVPAELFEGFDDREAGGFDPPPDDVFPALLVLAVDEPARYST
jgi:hypothetical protein